MTDDAAAAAKTSPPIVYAVLVPNEAPRVSDLYDDEKDAESMAVASGLFVYRVALVVLERGNVATNGKVKP